MGAVIKSQRKRDAKAGTKVFTQNAPQEAKEEGMSGKMVFQYVGK